MVPPYFSLGREVDLCSHIVLCGWELDMQSLGYDLSTTAVKRNDEAEQFPPLLLDEYEEALHIRN